jgi:uncharacterized membrane protein
MTQTILMVIMGIAVLAFFLWYGIFAIALPTTAALSFLRERAFRHRGKEAKSGVTQVATFNPQLGITMADGGDTIHKEKK